MDANRQSVQALAEELHAMQEEFDENLAFIRERFLYYNQLFDRYQSDEA